ncbi:hypothetical protein ACHAWF_015922 [Thalassiosira exigua]
MAPFSRGGSHKKPSSSNGGGHRPRPADGVPLAVGPDDEEDEESAPLPDLPPGSSNRGGGGKMKRLMRAAVPHRRRRDRSSGARGGRYEGGDGGADGAGGGGGGGGGGSGAKPPLHAADSDSKPSAHASPSAAAPGGKPPRRPSSYDLSEIASLLRSDLEVRDRKHRLKTYRDCFVGSEAVDCLVDRGVRGARDEAVETIRDLAMTLGLFEHVAGDRGFEDDYLFYKFVDGIRRKSSAGSGSARGSADDWASAGEAGGAGIVRMDKYGFLLDDARCRPAQKRASAGSTESGGGDSLSDLPVHDVFGGRAAEKPSAARTRRTVVADERRWENILEKVAPGGGGGGGGGANSKFGASYGATQSKVKYHARRGLPDALRRKAWTVLTGVDLILAENPGEYDVLVERAEEEWRKWHDLESADGDFSASCSSNVGGGGGGGKEGKKEISPLGIALDTIERDIHRTFPKHYLFHTVKDDDEDEMGSSLHKLDESVGSGSAMDDSEAVGSDDDDDEDDDDGGGGGDFDDDITMRAVYMGQDPTRVVEEKMKLYNENVLSSLKDADGIGLARIDPNNKGEEGAAAERRPARVVEDEDLKASQTSQGSLDIFGEEEEDDENDDGAGEGDEDPGPLRGRAGRRASAGSARSGVSSKEALGMGAGQDALRRVLRAYGVYDGEVGYCQGMNFIAAMFLTFLSEEEAFWLLVVVMNEEPYKLRELFGEDMAGTHEVLYIAEKLLAQFLPKLAAHLEGEGIHVSMFVTQWLLTVYTSTFPFDLVAKVWDSFLVEGWKVVYRVMLSLLEVASKDISDMNFEDILAYFRDFPSTVDGKAVMAGSLRIALKRKHIQRHVNEWRRHAAGAGGEGSLLSGEEKPRGWRHRRRPTGDSSVSSDTRGGSSLPGSLGSGATAGAAALSKIVPTNAKRLVAKAPKEVVVENLTDQLLPVIGTYKFAVLLHNVLTSDECSELVDRAEEAGFRDASMFDRRTNQAHRNCKRRMYDDPSSTDAWFERIVQAVEGTPLEARLLTGAFASNNPRNAGKSFRAAGLNERLRLLRYRGGEFFHAHNDVTFTRPASAGNRAGEQSLLSCHVYLNQKFKGGTTAFLGRGRFLEVKPKTGSVLLFEHDVLHEGRIVTHGKKYIVRTDVMYAVSDSVEGGFANGGASGIALTQQL